jgi:hypothetical protein
MARGWIHTVYLSATSDSANEVEGWSASVHVHDTKAEAAKRGGDSPSPRRPSA